VKLTTHLHLLQRLRIRGDTYPLPHTSSYCGASLATGTASLAHNLSLLASNCHITVMVQIALCHLLKALSLLCYIHYWTFYVNYLCSMCRDCIQPHLFLYGTCNTALGSYVHACRVRNWLVMLVILLYDMCHNSVFSFMRTVPSFTCQFEKYSAIIIVYRRVTISEILPTFMQKTWSPSLIQTFREMGVTAVFADITISNLIGEARYRRV
jgi:hypothetical protein